MSSHPLAQKHGALPEEGALCLCRGNEYSVALLKICPD